MKEYKLSERMSQLIETVKLSVLKNASESQQLYLNVGIHPVAIVAERPYCVSLRLSKTQNEKGCDKHLLGDKWNRPHRLEILIIEGPITESFSVLYQSEYPVSKNKALIDEYMRFSKTKKYPITDCVKVNETIIKEIVDFLTFGLLESLPYPGFEPA